MPRALQQALISSELWASPSVEINSLFREESLSRDNISHKDHTEPNRRFFKSGSRCASFYPFEIPNKKNAIIVCVWTHGRISYRVFACIFEWFNTKCRRMFSPHSIISSRGRKAARRCLKICKPSALRAILGRVMWNRRNDRVA